MVSTLIGLSLLSASGPDWLLDSSPYRTQVRQQEGRITLTNGLVSRTFATEPGFGTIALDAHGETLLRSLKPEIILTLNGEEHKIGGFQSPRNRAFIREADLTALKPSESMWTFEGAKPVRVKAPFGWKKVRPAGAKNWPPPGKGLEAKFRGPKSLLLTIRYEVYDGVPVAFKSFSLRNEGSAEITLDKFVSEHLAFVEGESIVDKPREWQRPNVSVITDYGFGGGSPSTTPRAVQWKADLDYDTQVNYEKTAPVDLVVSPEIGPGYVLKPGGTFESFRTYLIPHDSSDAERRGLGIRRFYRTLAPWVTENPIMLHLTSTDPKVVIPAIDQAAECGFEMVVISFWSGLDMENLSPENIAKFRAFREHANSKGVELGGYSLLASRRIDDENDVINPKTGKTGGAIFGSSPCLCSKWGEEYFKKIEKFMDQTGFQLLEHDGNYPGDVCASTTHPGHKGLEDSQWMQYEKIRNLYHRCREKGIFLNVPDNYFLNGSNKTGMGYREANWSLPRAQQHIHARQNLFDGTWEKPPTMGWMMTPLVEYQGGGKEATIEPLKDHLEDYGLHLSNNLGYGAQSCYRGPRLYDAPETKALVVKWVEWFKKHREILESDVIHVRRADGRNIDGILHANPSLKTPGMALFWNPTDQEMEQELTIPLYYTGIKGKAKMSLMGGRASTVSLDDRGRLIRKLKIPGKSMVWLTLEQG